jgi:methionyl-tRNA formyltransferase
LARALTLDVLHNFQTYTPVEQLSSEATYCKKISKSDGLVRFEEARALYNRYRAFTPWPGVFLESGLKLKYIAFEDDFTHPNAGEILAIDRDSILVACFKGTLRIFTVQPESKNEMSVISYINGKRLSIADILF